MEPTNKEGLLCYTILYKGLEHLQVLAPVVVLKPIPLGYWGTTVQEYLTLLYFEDTAQDFSQIGGLWPLCIRQVYWSNFSNSICSLHAVCLVSQSCLTLCDPMDRGPPGSSVHGILQAKVLAWVAMLSSRGSSQPRDWTQVSHIASGFLTVWATREALKVPPRYNHFMLYFGNSCNISHFFIIVIFAYGDLWSVIFDVTIAAHWRLRRWWAFFFLAIRYFKVKICMLFFRHHAIALFIFKINGIQCFYSYFWSLSEIYNLKVM